MGDLQEDSFSSKLAMFLNTRYFEMNGPISCSILGIRSNVNVTQLSYRVFAILKQIN